MQYESPPNHTEQLVENPEIVIHNSSFSSLDLKPGSKAQITDCYIDAQFKPRPTLITANNSDVTIQNCHFGNFINENGSTVLYGHSNSHIFIENSNFVQNTSPKGVLFLQNSCSIYINKLTCSHNVATSFGYSSIALQDGIRAVVINTMFRNNSALVGGAVIAIGECRVILTRCTFLSNKAFTGKTLKIFKNSNLQRANDTPDQSTIRTVTPVSSTLLNVTPSHGKKLEAIAANENHLPKRSSILMKSAVQQEDALLGPTLVAGGAVCVTKQSRLLVSNCVFDDNTSQGLGGAICAGFNATADIQETNFIHNSASQGGAIHVQQAHLRMKDCVFDDNISQGLGGAIVAGLNATLEIQKTNFTRNSASLGGAIGGGFTSTLDKQETHFTGNEASDDGGAIGIQHLAHLRMKDCVFDDNITPGFGGAIDVALNSTLQLQETNFTRNRATQQGGAIEVDQQSFLYITDCTFKDNFAELGGAIFGDLQAFLEINGSYFSNNNASEGGALNVQQQATFSLTNCRLEYNFASNAGGAILAYISVKLEIRETNFTGNSASGDGGALCVVSLSDCHAVQSVFDCNTAKASEGAVYMDSKLSLQLKNTNFMNNNANNGGAINIQDNSKVQIKMCSFWENFAKQAGGAITLKANSTAVIEVVISSQTMQ